MKKIIMVLLALVLSGCVSLAPSFDPSVSYNKKKEAAFMPTRAEYKSFDNGSSMLSFGVWAGEVGKTAANGKYQSLIFEKFEKNCGFNREELKEVRIVKHEPNLWYEVWVFNDEQSKRPDKTSGISVVMNYSPETDITQVSLVGDCLH